VCHRVSLDAADKADKSLPVLRMWPSEYTDCVFLDLFAIFRTLRLTQILFALRIFGECYCADL
jgi:hypothetical protein